VSPEDFADHPVSLAEARSDRTASAKDWTPRDALIAMLRSIDRGETKPEVLVIAFREGGGLIGYSVASPSFALTIGTLELAKHALVAACGPEPVVGPAS